MMATRSSEEGMLTLGSAVVLLALGRLVVLSSLPQLFCLYLETKVSCFEGTTGSSFIFSLFRGRVTVACSVVSDSL